MTEGDTKAVELSRQFPLLTDWCDVDQAENYKSFQEAGPAALEELERVAEAGYATRAGRGREDPIGGRLPPIWHKRVDVHQAAGRSPASERRRKRLGHNDARGKQCSRSPRSKRLPRCLLPMPTGAQGAQTCSSQGQWVCLLHLRSSCVRPGLRAAVVVKAGRSPGEAFTGGLLGYRPHTVLCGRSLTRGQGTRCLGKVSEPGDTTPAVAGLGLPTELGQDAARDHRTVDRIPAAAERRLFGGATLAREAGKAPKGSGRTTTAQRSSPRSTTQVDGWTTRLAHINCQAGQALGWNDLGVRHRMRSQGDKACQRAQEFGVHEAGVLGAKHIAQDDSMQLPECHLPLAPAFTVANTDRCISVWIWGYIMVWPAASRLVGRRNPRMGFGAAGGQNRRPSLAIRVGAVGSGHFSQAVWASDRKSGCAPDD